jgi:hypothetical protein
VRFRVTAIFLSQSPEPFTAFPADAELEGTVIDFSDSGEQRAAFAVVEVVRPQSVIVPVSDLQEVMRGEN